MSAHPSAHLSAHPATDLIAHVPDCIRALAPYVGGRPIDEVARQIGMPEDQIVKLASNENPLGLGPKAQAAIAQAAKDLGRYPDGNGFALKQALSQRFGMPAEWITLGNGSNDILELVAQAFLQPGTESLMSAHAFAVYSLATAASGARAVVVPAKPGDLGHDLPAMARAITPQTRVVWVANPNNPTGSLLGAGELQAFLRDLPADLLMVLDEAYTEYLSPEQRYPVFDWVAQHPNLIVTRSFSKAYGLAGLRVGYGVAQAPVTDILNRIRQPFNVNSLAQAAAIAAIGDEDFLQQAYRVNAEGRDQLVTGLAGMGISCLAGAGNFVLADLQPLRGAEAFAGLLQRGVITRPVDNYGLPHHLRISIGLAHENAAFLKAMTEVVAALRAAHGASQTTKQGGAA